MYVSQTLVGAEHNYLGTELYLGQAFKFGVHIVLIIQTQNGL